MQSIFQNPYESLSPRFSVLDSVAEPLRLLKVLNNEDEVLARVKDTLKAVGLPQSDDFLDRYPHELSGGMRQRVGIARAYTLNPSFIVADEPVSMLDVSIRVGVLKVMKELVQKFQTAFLFITHDLALARYMCDRIGVMYLGRIVELGKTEDIIQNSLHPYTKALVSAVPNPDPDAKRTEEIPIAGEIPSGIILPKGCRFHPRCVYATSKCQETDPELLPTNNNHFVACIRFREINQKGK
jgi:oligopeptide/dipeptide ABC transporter ATP-binding protein